MEVKTSFKCKAFKYDFAVDGGAIGSINTGVFLPSCTPFTILLRPISDLTSGGAATVDIGIPGNTTGIANNATDGKNGNLTDYNAATFGWFITWGGPTNPGFTTTRAATTLIGPAQVQVTIGAFALTAGAFICTIYYNEF